MTGENRFDFELLEIPLFQFAVVADSHDKLPTDKADREFPSRSLQHDRVTTLLTLMHNVPADFVIHMGDLVQEYPETSGFSEAFATAVAAFHQLPVPVHHVAGNHDVGDKPDRTMPTHPASLESLAEYHRLCGQSWYRIDRADCCLLIINSQILDTGMPEEAEQRTWLEAEMQSAEGKRILLFLHLPLYLGDEAEPALGNYDVLGNESRAWLLQLIRRHRVRFVAGAHVHFAFFDKIGDCEYHQLASPCFTRPGFSHLFSSAAPPERGRNDRDKLGFYLVRVFPQEIRLHFIRTSGATTPEALVPANSRIMVFPADGGQRGSALGVTLREPILREVEVPIAFPSVVRQRVRNDYPFYNLLEMGAGHLRVPLHDWENGAQRNRLTQLTAKGVSLTLFSLDETGGRLPVLCPDLKAPDGLEWQLPGIVTPPETNFRQWVHTCRERGLKTSLAPVIPGCPEAGKQHPRTRIGYSPGGLAEINAWLHQQDIGVDRLLIDFQPDISWIELWRQGSPDGPAWDLKLEFSSTNDDDNCRMLAEAFAIAVAIPGARLFVDPLTDHDRTMDAVHGLCDNLHNPRLAFSIYRTLNGIFFPEQPAGGSVDSITVQRVHDNLYALTTLTRHYALVLSGAGYASLPTSWCLENIWDLRRGQSRAWTVEHPVQLPFLISYTKKS